jgi:hypothetical protein
MAIWSLDAFVRKERRERATSSFSNTSYGLRDTITSLSMESMAYKILQGSGDTGDM